jgi:hypothetical protein
VACPPAVEQCGCDGKGRHCSDVGTCFLCPVYILCGRCCCLGTACRSHASLTALQGLQRRGRALGHVMRCASTGSTTGQHNLSLREWTVAVLEGGGYIKGVLNKWHGAKGGIGQQCWLVRSTETYHTQASLQRCKTSAVDGNSLMPKIHCGCQKKLEQWVLDRLTALDRQCRQCRQCQGTKYTILARKWACL